MSTVSVKIQPLGDRVVVKALARDTVTKSGIVLPDTAKEKPQEGEGVERAVLIAPMLGPVVGGAVGGSAAGESLDLAHQPSRRHRGVER